MTTDVLLLAGAAAGVFAFAVGVERTLDSTLGAVLVAMFGLGLIAAGISLQTLSAATRSALGPTGRLT